MALEKRFRKREQKESVGNDNERSPRSDNRRVSSFSAGVGVRGFLTLLTDELPDPPAR